MYLLRVMSFVLLLVVLSTCDSSTETGNPIPFMSLHVGDVRQYFIEADSTYTTYSIIGETFRTDGQKVFIGISKWGNSGDTTSHQAYYFIKDGYYYSTQLDTNSEGWDLEDNPYVEQRLAKLFPQDGEKWILIDGMKSPQYFTANFEGAKSTPAKDFKNVFGFSLDTLLTTYYAEGYGHIGALFTSSNISVLANYLKIDGKEYGKYVPQDKMPKRNIFQNKTIKRKYGIFGERLGVQ